MTLAIIPARGESKGLHRKNILPFAGKPLIYWTIRAALDAGLDRVVVSTEDDEIAAVARACGADVPFIRPPELATDKTGTLSVILHAIARLGYSGPVVILQPTSPLRRAADISAALDMHSSSGRHVVSMTHAKPWLFSTTEDGGVEPVLPVAGHRQQAAYLVPNGAIYVVDADRLRQGETIYSGAIPYLMPGMRSIDIDEMHELVAAEAIFHAALGEQS